MNKEKYDYYLGSLEKIYCGYSTHEEIAKHSASGGIVATVFMWLLENKIVDGCLVYSLVIDDGKFTITHKIVTSPEQLVRSGGSIYIDFPAISLPIIEDIKAFHGTIAVVGLPCAISALEQLRTRDELLNTKIAFTLGLFCGHTSKRSLIETVLKRKSIRLENIQRFFFRKGLWRGNSEVILKNGETIRFPTTHFTTYQNLFIDSAKRCMRCMDHYAEAADFSTGDIWKKEFKNSARKHSVFVSRKPETTAIIDKMIETDRLKATIANEKLLFQANKRAVIFHKAIRARAMVGRLFGYNIKVPQTAATARWNEIAAALILMPIIRISDSRFRKILFIIPRKILYGVLIGFKLLTNF